LSASHILLIFGGSLDFSLALARQAAKRHWAVARACDDVTQESEWISVLSSLGCERMFIKSPLAEENHFRHVLERVQRRWGQVDTVINLADQPCLGLFETSSDDDWHWAIKHNLSTVAHGCKAAISLMKRQGHGQLLNITTQAARLPQPGQALTSAVQGAVVSLTETLQAELSPLGIDVRLACIDYVEGLLPKGAPRAQTPLDAARFERQKNSDQTLDQTAATIFRGLQHRDFLILTHKEGRSLWRRYRLTYNKWLMLTRKLAERLRPEQRFKQENHK
jgi:NAD(P)-dependent dehydrogenase (short-subunit alcohol dehydrogenase family)